jgi:SSS family transporter
MTSIDWIILAIYIVGIVGMSLLIGRGQKSQEDYYLGGRRIKPWQVGLSVMANQVSAISLIGAPAFIAVRTGGGLRWLQYEFAIPLAMMIIMLALVPVYHKTRGITIYEYLETRFGRPTRTLLSLVFLLSRGLGAGVVLLATSIVTSVCLGISLAPTILLIGVISLLYTSIGGIKADIYSDIIQLIILWSGAIVSIIVILRLLGADAFSFAASEAGRLRIFDMKSTGFGDGQSFAFWPMLVGGFFLYISYYGCDQSQAQRLLTTKTEDDARKALFWNGLLRFPLVLTYCTFGLFLIPFIHNNPAFAGKLQGRPPDFTVPYFMMEYVPKGLLGLVVAGIFAASMSSIDSVLNSLSAATWRDFLERFIPSVKKLNGPQVVRLSRAVTLFWGAVATIFAIAMIGGSETVLELVNKIGSAFYGPILAVFWLGIFARRVSQTGAIAGLVGGVGVNIYLWKFHAGDISWLWWNVIGFAAAVFAGYAISLMIPHGRARTTDISDYSICGLLRSAGNKNLYIILAIAFAVILIFSIALGGFLKSAPA